MSYLTVTDVKFWSPPTVSRQPLSSSSQSSEHSLNKNGNCDCLIQQMSTVGIYEDHDTRNQAAEIATSMTRSVSPTFQTSNCHQSIKYQSRNLCNSAAVFYGDIANNNNNYRQIQMPTHVSIFFFFFLSQLLATDHSL